MLNLSQVAILEKNSLESDSPWITLFELKIDGESEPARFCRNTEDIKFDGHTWYAFPIQISEISDSNKDQGTQTSLKVANFSGVLDSELEKYDGFVGDDLSIHLIFVKDNIPSKISTIDFEVVGCANKNGWVSLELSGFNPHNIKTPRATMKKLECRYRHFKGMRCRYSGSETFCDRSYKSCLKKGNAHNFGGAPTLGWNGIYI